MSHSDWERTLNSLRLERDFQFRFEFSLTARDVLQPVIVPKEKRVKTKKSSASSRKKNTLKGVHLSDSDPILLASTAPTYTHDLSARKPASRNRTPTTPKESQTQTVTARKLVPESMPFVKIPLAQPTIPLCAICSNQGHVHCDDCNQAFCESCDLESHASLEDHTRTVLEPALPRSLVPPIRVDRRAGVVAARIYFKFPEATNLILPAPSTLRIKEGSTTKLVIKETLRVVPGLGGSVDDYELRPCTLDSDSMPIFEPDSTPLDLAGVLTKQTETKPTGMLTLVLSKVYSPKAQPIFTVDFGRKTAQSAWETEQSVVIFDPEMTLRELRERICVKRDLDPEIWRFTPCKGNSHTCELDAKLGELGVNKIKLRPAITVVAKLNRLRHPRLTGVPFVKARVRNRSGDMYTDEAAESFLGLNQPESVPLFEVSPGVYEEEIFFRRTTAQSYKAYPVLLVSKQTPMVMGIGGTKVTLTLQHTKDKAKNKPKELEIGSMAISSHTGPSKARRQFTLHTDADSVTFESDCAAEIVAKLNFIKTTIY